ncbi:hypothetical protein CRM22_005791 [Opisthorchis felineus]|uniref:RING-type E3 ubiquitin transferase BRCA1 n=1 Tax=Opisthorchis felineus TaxID=147828 RepID=A0A4S2LPH6_OPIFE|nr:hypothetical protein CRM22_005791 [Opisthorchis felineus]
MVRPSDIEFCLGVIKRFLVCPICLDNFRNPLITACAHLFCAFCIQEHIGRKRQANCPLCNREFTRRSLKVSGKVDRIASACEAILTAYEVESGNSVSPSHLPSEQLHLSQELTQYTSLLGTLSRSKSRESLQPNEFSRFQSVSLPEYTRPNRVEDCTPVRKSISHHHKRKLTKINSNSEKIKPCRFLIPLRRMFSAKRSRASLPLRTVPVVPVERAGPSKVPSRSESVTKTHTTKSPSLRNFDDHELPFAGDGLSFRDNVDHTHVHCSACGETLRLHPESFRAFSSPRSHNTTNQNWISFLTPRLSCSISSTYWQAEDPSDAIFDRAPGDTDYKCPFQELEPTTPAHVEKVFRDTACQTSPSQSPSRCGSPQCRHFLTADVEDQERLRRECNELEAVVTVLQQQLEAQVGELSPNTTAELLRAAGTEPVDADEDEAQVLTATKDFKRPITSDAFETKVGEASDSQSSPKSSTEFDHRLQSELFPPMIPGNCPSEAIDIIPSSQAEEELDCPVEGAVMEPVSEQNKVNALRVSSQSSLPVTRVEASQPPSSCATSLLCEFNPLVSTSSQNLVDRLANANSAYLSECPETNLESQANTLNPLGATEPTEQRQQASTKVPPSALVITGSSLSGPDMTLLYLFCQRFGLSQYAQFVPGKTTHVIMKSEADRPRVVKRTLKYFMAILNRAWIVNTDWVRQCLATSRILDETPFEIEGDTVCGDCHEGPRRGRLNVPARPQPLDLDDSNHGPFAGLWLCAYDSLGLLSLADFKRLATDGGATRVFDKPADLASAVNQYMNPQLTRSPRPRAVILTSHDSQGFNISKCQEVYRIRGFPIISVDWMLNCISLFRRIPISQTYRICPAPGEQPAAPLSTRNRPQ